MKTNTKEEIIRIRVSKKEKETLKQLASSTNETLSSYMLQKSMYTDSDSLKSLPSMIDSWKFLNEVCHEVEKSNDEQLKNRIKNILNN